MRLKLKNKRSLIIAIDVGNTNINIGVFKGSRLKLKLNIPTKSSRSILRNKLRQLLRPLKLAKTQLDMIIICSVVPAKDKLLKRELKAIFKARIVFCGKDIIVPIRNLYKRPKSVGQDRLVTAYGTKRLYGNPLIIIDFGTAVTIEAVSKNGAYLGGIITPGLRITLEALGQKTALLPNLDLSRKVTKLPLIGRTTSESMYSGLFFGFSLMISALINELKKKIGKNAKVIATGGDIGNIRKFLSQDIDIIDKDLTLKALQLLA